MKPVIILFAALFILLAPEKSLSQSNVTVAGKDVRLRLGGTIQPRLTFAQDPAFLPGGESTERLGFGVRRARVRFYVGIRDDFRIFLQAEASGTSMQMLDIRGEYDVNKKLTLRFGRFVGAQPRGMAITLHSDVDAIDRPAIADYWARNTIGADARDYGLEAIYKIPEWEFRTYLHNGWNGNNYRLGSVDNSVTALQNDKSVALNGMIRYFPNSLANSEFGGHIGYNTSKNVHTVAFGQGRKFLDYSLHAYYGSFAGDQTIRLKFDLISIRYEEISTTIISRPEYKQNFLGASVFSGYLLRKDTEIFGRFEFFQPDTEAPDLRQDLYTIGATYSFSAAAGRKFMEQKITGAYTYKTFNDPVITDPAHIFMIQWQFYF